MRPGLKNTAAELMAHMHQAYRLGAASTQRMYCMGWTTLLRHKPPSRDDPLLTQAAVPCTGWHLPQQLDHRTQRIGTQSMTGMQMGEHSEAY